MGDEYGELKMMIRVGVVKAGYNVAKTSSTRSDGMLVGEYVSHEYIHVFPHTTIPIQ